MRAARSLVLMVSLAAVAGLDAAPERAPGPQPGNVYREYAAHQRGDDWRVTDPDARAAGAREFLPNAVLAIQVDDLEGAVRAEALLDRWGGHLRTTAKRIRFNEGEWITVPEIDTVPPGAQAELYYSQDNPIVPVPLADLREGRNTFEGTCGVLEEYGWGQWGLYSLILRVYYDAERRPEHPRGRIVSPQTGAGFGDLPRISVEAASRHGIARVDVLAWYDGFDEDGDGVFADWHQSYFQAVRGGPAELRDHVGTAWRAPWEALWDTRWVPDQAPGSVRLVARIQECRGLWYVTPVVDGLSLERSGASVRLYRTRDMPRRFGVRVGRRAECVVELPAEADHLARAREARLALRTWHGWEGHHSPLALNDHTFPIDGKNHFYDFDLLPLPVSALRSGRNVFRIHSDTEHHMLEVLWPGPALLVRYEPSP